MHKLVGCVTAAILSVALSSSPAAAGDPACLWKALSPAAKDRLAESLKQPSLAKAFSLKLPPAESSSLGVVCIVDRANGKAAFQAMIWEGIMELSGETLESQFRVKRANLDRAWIAISAEDRLAYTRLTDKITSGQKTADSEVIAVWTPILTANNVSIQHMAELPKPELKAIMLYYEGKAKALEFEEQF